MWFLVKTISENKSGKRGALYLRDDVLVYKGFWRSYSFPLTDLIVVEAYIETTVGLEEVCCIDLSFENKNKLLFDGNDEPSQNFLNRLFREKLKVEPIDWTQPFLFSFNKTILYQRQ